MTVPGASEAETPGPVGGGLRVTLPSHSNSNLRPDMPPACRNGCFSWERGRGFHGRHGFGGFIIVERPFDYAQDREVPVIVEREVVVREVATPPPPTPSSEGEGKRKAYVIGRHYASLPGGCMKMIEEGASFYYCGGGEWYRPVGKQYRAVREP